MDKLNHTIAIYAYECRASFEEEPFNEVDSVLFSWVSYLHFPEELLGNCFCGCCGENVDLSGDGRMLLADHSCCYFRDLAKEQYYPALLKNVWSQEDTIFILRSLAENPRYRDVRLCLRREELDQKITKQFAAVSFQIDPETVYVAYRGTDSTLTGWEEDCKMCLKDPVPSQMAAAEYLDQVGQIFRGRLILGGHSKGGNLAVFAAANCDAEVQARIDVVYSHDGPGFVAAELQKEGYAKIRSRIRKTAPQFSIFGMLLKQEAEPKIIYSYENGILQHNPTSWKTEGYSLSEYWYTNKQAEHIRNKLNNWVEGLTYEDRELLIDTVFEVLEETGAKSFREIGQNLPHYLPIIVRGILRLEPSMQMFLMDILKQLVLAPSQMGTDPKREHSGYSQDIIDLMNKYDALDEASADSSTEIPSDIPSEIPSDIPSESPGETSSQDQLPSMKEIEDDFNRRMDHLKRSVLRRDSAYQEKIKDALDDSIAAVLYKLRH